MRRDEIDKGEGSVVVKKSSVKSLGRVSGFLRQALMRDAVRRTISLEQNGKTYKLNDKIATLVVRPRGGLPEELAMVKTIAGNGPT